MEPGGCSQGESRPEGVESDRREMGTVWLGESDSRLISLCTCDFYLN